MIKVFEQIINSATSIKKQSPVLIAEELTEKAADHFGDRRYKVKILAAPTNFTSLIFTYRGNKFYASYNYDTNLYEVEYNNR